MAMALKAGGRLRSAACDTQVMVIKTPAGALELRCGGAPMLAGNDAPQPQVALDPAFASQTD